MSLHIVYSRYQRNGRDEVLVLPAGDRSVHLHPGVNAVDADAWAAAAKADGVARLLADKQLEDRGAAPAEPEPPAEAKASEGGAGGGGGEVVTQQSKPAAKA